MAHPEAMKKSGESVEREYLRIPVIEEREAWISPSRLNSR
jgi:hypothetical protein